MKAPQPLTREFLEQHVLDCEEVTVSALEGSLSGTLTWLPKADGWISIRDLPYPINDAEAARRKSCTSPKNPHTSASSWEHWAS